MGDAGRRDNDADDEDDRSRFPIREGTGVDAEVGIGGILAGLGSGDYPMQSEEQEEEKRIQDVSLFYLPLDPDQPEGGPGTDNRRLALTDFPRT